MNEQPSCYIAVHAFDCSNRIKWCHKPLSAKQVNNEDLDHQLGPQTLTALLTPLEPIDQGFHAGSAQLHGMINCYAQIPSYHWGSFVKASLHNEKLDLGATMYCGYTFVSSVWFVSPQEHTYIPKKKRQQYGGLLYVWRYIISHMRSHFYCILITGGTQDSLREMPAVIYYGLITARLPSRKAFNKKKWLWKCFILNVSVFVEYRVCLTTLWSEEKLHLNQAHLQPLFDLY